MRLRRGQRKAGRSGAGWLISPALLAIALTAPQANARDGWSTSSIPAASPDAMNAASRDAINAAAARVPGAAAAARRTSDTTTAQRSNLGAPEGAVPPSPTATQNIAVAGTDRFGDATKSGEREVIVEVYLRRKTKLSDGLIAYLQGDDLLIPLQEVMILLEFAIQETPRGADGWFLNESRRFKLDLAAGEVVSDGKTFRLGAHDAKRIEKELFVSARSLSKWLPLNFYADLRALALQINPREQVSREAREKRSKKKYGSIHQFRSVMPRQETPYQAVSVPGIEVDTATGYSSRRGGRFYNSGTLRAFGDLAWMNGELFITGTDRGVADARIRLGRSDPDGGLLGPLNASAWEIGDVGGVSAPLISGAVSGRGVRVTSRPGSYIAEFDRITLEDSLPVGWEVELYRNNILMASYGPSNAGRYRFESVPLLRGTNEIRLEFYGPQGQRRSEVNQYEVGQGQIPVGRFNYDVSLHEVGRSVFGFTNWVRYNQLYENTAFGGGARFDYGLTRNLSVSAGLFAQPLPIRVRQAGGDDYRYYGTLGARTMIGNFAVAVDTAVDDQGGVAGGVTASTRLAGWNVSARHEQFMNGFASEASYGASAALRRYAYRTSNTSARADTFLGQLWPGVYMNAGVTGGYTTYDGSDSTWRVGNTIGLSAGSFSLSNDLYYGGAISGGRDGIFGSARVNYRLFSGVSLRASADYDLRDLAEVDGYSFGLTAALPWDVTMGLGYAQRFDRYSDLERTESYYATLRRDFGIAEIGFLAAYGRYDYGTPYLQTVGGRDPRLPDDDYRFAVTVSFSTFTDPDTLATEVSSERIARKGALRASAFYDMNQNGIRDNGEPLVPGVKVVHAGYRTPYYTAGDSESPRVAQVGSGGWTDVALDRSGMPSAELNPGSKGVAVLPRPGVVSRVELPVVATAGIEGRVDLNMGEELRAMPNVRVQIVRKADASAGIPEKVVAEANTEFDGVFSLAGVPIGEYVVRVEPDQAKQIGARGPVEMPITLTPDTGILDGVALKMDRKS